MDNSTVGKTLYEILSNINNRYKLAVADKSQVLLSGSFVIPAYNSASSLEACLSSVAQLQRLDTIKEVIVIDDASTDDTSKILSRLQDSFSSHFNLIVIRNQKRRYCAYARNRGFERATGDLIYCIDSDMILPSDYVVQHACQQQMGESIVFSLRQGIAAPEQAIVSLQSTDDWRESLLASHKLLQDAPFNLDGNKTIAELCLTCAVTYRRADLVKVGGCPENFIGWGFNDTAIAAKVLALGRPAVPLRTCNVFHLDHAPRSGDSAKKQAEYKRNKTLYEYMLKLPFESTLQQYIHLR